MPKTIALVSNTSWSFVKFRLKLLIELKQAGYNVLVLAPEDEESPVFTRHGLTYIPLRKLRQKGKNPIHDYELYREIRSLYKRWKPDLAIHYTIKPNIYGSLAASHSGIPCIGVVTGLGYTYINGGLLGKVTDLLYRNAFKKARQVWFLNRDDQRVFVHDRRIIPAAKAVLINGEGIDAREAFNPQAQERQPAPLAGVRFVFIGRLLHDKGIREYVHAAESVKARYPDASFDIVGYLNVGNPSAVDEPTVRRWEAQGAVRYRGAVADVRPLLLQYDCVVLPSYREGMSTTLMEAAAMERPLIASDIPGCRELIDDGSTGFLCEPKCADGLAECMVSFIRLPPDKRQAMGRRGREKMLREFDMDAIIARYLEVIPKILKVVGK